MSTQLSLAVALLCAYPTISGADSPLVDQRTVFLEEDGVVAVEAEHFFEQAKTETRKFELVTSQHTPTTRPDGDVPHVAGASGGAHLELLPDTRRTHADKLIRGTNFAPDPGQMAILSYHVHIQHPGRYYVWVRAYSTGSEDNGLHVGLDGTWPASGQRLQWCQGKRSWWWESKQRTAAEHCGQPHKIFLDVRTPGKHTIHFSMREDGFEFDKWLMTLDREMPRPGGFGPRTRLAQGPQPPTFPFVRPTFPEHWGDPPRIQTRDLRTLPGGYGQGSSTLAAWIQEHLDRDAKEKAASSHDLNVDRKTSPTKPLSDALLIQPRGTDGDGSVKLTGELRTWHKMTVNLNGPFAHEQDNQPNPFTDYRMTVRFRHADGTEYVIPGYFAADGNAAQTSAEQGTQWRAHFAPDRVGDWTYTIGFHRGAKIALNATAEAHATPEAHALAPFHGQQGKFQVETSNKHGRDLRAHGRLQYVGQRYLRFAGTGRYFLKVGADAPETLLAFCDFDNTHAGNPKQAPLKTWKPHLQDWQEGDPTWQNGKGKGLIGAINYLSGKGCNAFSFLTYNAGGDGNNVWPFIHRDDKLHYDCSKLDQWGIVFDHGTQRGMYLHFKMQETENDDHIRGKQEGFVPESLDGGNLGPQRRLYCRELIARFGHNLALNWNLGEENTQTTVQQREMIHYIAHLDAYDHNIVVHTYPDQQDKVYRPLLGTASQLTGTSLQNSSLQTTHAQTVKWIQAAQAAGRPWVVAFDESGSAAHAQCPDLGYRGFDGHDRLGKYTYTPDAVRQQTLWGHLMAGGAGCEYYFGYQFAENDLVCEDWRSRDQSWDYCRIAVSFFQQEQIPFWEMENHDALVGNPTHATTKFCLAKPGHLYLIYLPDGGNSALDLTQTNGTYSVRWFDPRSGGMLHSGAIGQVTAGQSVSLGEPPTDAGEDWLVVVRRQP